MMPTRPSLLATIAAMAAATPVYGAFTPERTDPDNCTGSGTSSHYSKCVARPSTATGSEDNGTGFRYCLPVPAAESAGLTTLPATLSIEQKSGNDFAVAVLEVENCRQPSGAVQGEFSLVVDNSKSICWNADGTKGTDCAGERKDFAKMVVDDLFDRDTLTPPSKMGLVGYGGRDGDTYEGNFTHDTKYGLDPDFAKRRCRDQFGQAGAWTGAPRSPEIWDERSASGPYYSRCELIHPVEKANKSLLQSFIDLAGAHPRGATDITYFLEAAERIASLEPTSPLGRNAVIITDGLPNIPRRIPRAVCEKSPILMQALADMGGKFEKDPQGREYCYDRQFKYAANMANRYAEGRIDFDFNPANAPDRFQAINVYNVLFVSDGYAYADQDYETGENLFPHDFLIENSARTGNGKVKFAYVRGPTPAARATLHQALLEVFKEHFDARSVHHVTVQITPAGSTAPNAAYNAVSSSEFEKGFGIKLVGLATGTNSVTITTYYNDGNALVHNMTVNVGTTSAYTSTGDVSCADAASNRTVDGDDPASTHPQGDGVLPFANAATKSQCRVFRNSDTANDLTPADFMNPASANSESLRAKTGRLRIQGGTGNCGVVALRDDRWVLVNPLLLLLPFLGVLVLRRKRR